MPYVLPTGRKVSADLDFTLDDIYYMSGWLRKASEEDKQSLGIVWEDDPVEEPPAMTNDRLRVLIDAERDRRLSKFVFGYLTYDFDELSRSRIAKAHTLALSAVISGATQGNYRWADPDHDFTWIQEDNSLTIMDAPTCLQFGMAAARWEGLHIIAARTLKDMQEIPLDYTNDQYWPS